jgi:hypothetical protein
VAGPRPPPVWRRGHLADTLSNFRFGGTWSIAVISRAGTIISLGYTLTVVLLVEQFGWLGQKGFSALAAS